MYCNYLTVSATTYILYEFAQISAIWLLESLIFSTAIHRDLMILFANEYSYFPNKNFSVGKKHAQIRPKKRINMIQFVADYFSSQIHFQQKKTHGAVLIIYLTSLFFIRFPKHSNFCVFRDRATF